MFVITLEGTPTVQFLIPDSQELQRNGRTNFWGGSDTSATGM